MAEKTPFPRGWSFAIEEIARDWSKKSQEDLVRKDEP